MKTNPLEARGALLDSYDGVQIYEGFPYNFYEKKVTQFSAREREVYQTLKDTIARKFSIKEIGEELKVGEPSAQKEFMDEFNSRVIQAIEVNELLNRFPTTEQFDDLRETIIALFKKYVPEVKKPQQLAEKVLANTIGFGELYSLLLDEHLEEVMVNGVNRYVFIFHKRHGMCKTNLLIKSNKSIHGLITKIAYTVGKHFDEANPLLDARLPDGSRANATFSTVTPFGHSITIRKFTREPLSIIDLIGFNTLSSEMAAFLWLVVEGLNIEPMNVLVTGGAGSGKTTLLNALSAFVRFNDRVISIEDTLELDLGARDNWIQMESRPKMRNVEAVSMDDCLKNALRMRPDRLVLGEVRGEEAQTLFVAMDTGHRGILGTVHSNSAREMLLRLKTAPMNVPDSMLSLLNLSVVMMRSYDRKYGVIRRVREVAELERMDEKTLLGTVYEWKREKDRIERTEVPIRMLDTLSEATDLSKRELMNELFIRQRILEWLLKNKIKSFDDVTQTVQRYYHDPTQVIDKIQEDTATDLKLPRRRG